MLTGPVAGALIGYGVFAVLLTVIGALFADGKLSIPEENWKDLGLGASVLAGLLLFILAVAFGAAIVARAADQPQYRRRLARRDARLRPPARH